jgi:phosphoribosylanthranilate isomerase
MRPLVKICGINSAEALRAASDADLVGFVFFPPSPRAVTPEGAAAISATLPGGPGRVGLFVDPTDDEIGAALSALPLDLLQLHGAETPGRCAELRARFGVPVMKALGIATPDDLAPLPEYAPVVDRFLLDAKPPPEATRPGGNAESFDWALVAGLRPGRPWLLAGGLQPGNVAAALQATRADGADVSSGVERARGVKDEALVRGFIEAVRSAG